MKGVKVLSCSVLLSCVLPLALPLAACAQQSASAPAAQFAPPPLNKAGQLRLADNLDREDGYCLDILGSGEYIRFDMPMTVHNCKLGLYADEAVEWQADGKIRFPAYNACATAAGVNQSVLAGAAVMPRACDERSPFLESQYLQHFRYRDDGRIELAGSGLCLTAGADSAATFDATHRWRTLSMQACETAPLAQSQWYFHEVKE